MTEPRFETHTFTVGESSHVSILEPAPMPEQYGGPVYVVNHESMRAKSKFPPLILWGTALDVEMPPTWADAIGRAKSWKTGLSKLFIGSKLSVRIAIHDGNFMDKPRPRTMRVPQAVYVYNDKPSDQALAWLEEQIAERRGWLE